MGKATYHEASRQHTFTIFIGMAVLAFLILVKIAGATQDPMIWNTNRVAFSQQNRYNRALKPYQKAIETFDKVIGINSQSKYAWNNGGDTQSQQNKYDEALRAYDRAIEINPQNSDAWDSKVDPLNKLKRYDEAVNAQNKANEINLKKSKSGTEGNNGE